MSEGRRKAFPELYFGEAWNYYIIKLLAFSLCEKATDIPRQRKRCHRRKIQESENETLKQIEHLSRKIGRIGDLNRTIGKNLSGIRSENVTCKSVYTISTI